MTGEVTLGFSVPSGFSMPIFHLRKHYRGRSKAFAHLLLRAMEHIANSFVSTISVAVYLIFYLLFFGYHASNFLGKILCVNPPSFSLLLYKLKVEDTCYSYVARMCIHDPFAQFWNRTQQRY